MYWFKICIVVAENDTTTTIHLFTPKILRQLSFATIINPWQHFTYKASIGIIDHWAGRPAIYIRFVIWIYLSINKSPHIYLSHWHMFLTTTSQIIVCIWTPVADLSFEHSSTWYHRPWSRSSVHLNLHSSCDLTIRTTKTDQTEHKNPVYSGQFWYVC